jgi:hypothetical protein
LKFSTQTRGDLENPAILINPRVQRLKPTCLPKFKRECQPQKAGVSSTAYPGLSILQVLTAMTTIRASKFGSF